MYSSYLSLFVPNDDAFQKLHFQSLAIIQKKEDGKRRTFFVICIFFLGNLGKNDSGLDEWSHLTAD